MLRVLGLGVGGLLSLLPPVQSLGKMLMLQASKLQVEDCVQEKQEADPSFYELKNEILSIDYEAMYKEHIVR